MSEKKSKEKRHTMQLPIYNPASQLDYINNVCKSMDFSPEKFLTFILADWILHYQRASLQSNEQTAFMSFLSSVEKQKSEFEKIKEIMENEKK